jgi:hypothetical protein
MIYPIPENLALVFLPFAIYFYYYSLKNSTVKPAIISGLLLVLTILTHTAASLCLFITISSISLVELILYREKHVLKNYAAFLLGLVVFLTMGAAVILLVAPDLLQNLINNGISGVTGIATSLTQSRAMGLNIYISTLGIPVIFFGAIGSAYALKNRDKKDIFVIVWLLSMILLSVAYLVGINVISYRVLIYILLPLSILGSLGVKIIYNQLKSIPSFSSKGIHSMFLLILLLLCAMNGFLNLEDPKIAVFKVENQLGGVQIAPPSSAEADLANWFKQNGNKSRSIITSNQFTGTFITAQTGIPLSYNFSIYAMKDSPNATLPQVQKEGIGYIIYDKKLVLSPPDNSRLYVIKIPSEFYSLDYFSQDIATNLNKILPSYARIVYENEEFIISEVVYP